MSIEHHRTLLRRSAAAVLTVVCLLTATLVGSTSLASAAGSSSYDKSIGASDCDLLGRVFAKGHGCSRTQCVSGAKHFRVVMGAEACQLRGQGEYGFVSTIDSRRCSALHRRWIKQVNYCASYPDRSATAVYDAPQCMGAASVYVLLTEADGYYDECLTPQRVDELVQMARVEGSDLTAEATARSSVQCGYRPAQVYVDGKCVDDPGPRPARGGTLMIGDSLTYRGTDELSRLRPTFTIDGEPARQLTKLAGELDYYVSGHGQPTGLIIALGAVPPPKGYGRSDLARDVKRVPGTTKVMLVMPFAVLPSGKISPNTAKIAGWMKTIDQSRGRTCVADWPSFVRSHPGMLQDGVHVRNSLEKKWARFISQQWSRC